MVQCLSAFLEFCYLVRRNTITTGTLWQIEDALARFHRDRVVFEETGVRVDGISLPHQHSLKHYPTLIQLFGAPNGLCSSITESKHIKAVKEPYRRSNRFEALGQMLLMNQRLDKLAAARTEFMARGMLHGPCLSVIDEDDIWQDPDLPAYGQGEDLADRAERHAALEEDEDGGAVEGVEPLGEVTLAKRKGTPFITCMSLTYSPSDSSWLSTPSCRARAVHQRSTAPRPSPPIPFRTTYARRRRPLRYRTLSSRTIPSDGVPLRSRRLLCPK